MYDLKKFTLRNMSECGLALRGLSKNAESMEEVGDRIVQYLYDHLIDSQTQRKSCALVRLFKTHSYQDLTPQLQDSARQLLGHNDIPPSLKCLTLLGTAGDQPDWNSRYASRGHQTIPLANEAALAKIPMISQLISQLGIDPGAVLTPDPSLMVDIEQNLFNVFYIPVALGSPYIPAQNEFVIPYKIESIVGFGGLLPSGNMFAVIMFSKTAIPHTILNLIRPLALSVKMAILPFDDSRIFADSQLPENNKHLDETTACPLTGERLRSQCETLTQLLDVSEQATLLQSDQLQQVITELQQVLDQLQKTQTQMVQNEKMSSLGQLVAGVAHEINNPVNFIHGNLMHVQDYTQDLLNFVDLYQHHYPHPVSDMKAEAETIDLEFMREDLPKMLSSMRMGTDRIRQIVLSLRNFSRMDEAEIKPVNIHEGIDSTLLILQHRLKPTAYRPEIRLIKHYGQLPLVECYAGQLNQVFMNILTNAIDALEELNANRSFQEIQENPSCITIQTAIINRCWAEISIADNGPGIPEAVQDKIFDPFFTTKPIGKGTGMGMSISYQIITEKHNGKLECFSRPNQGTEFVIQIPMTNKSLAS